MTPAIVKKTDADEAAPEVAAVKVPAEAPLCPNTLPVSIGVVENPLTEALVEAGIHGRGSTWIAGQDRGSFKHKVKVNYHHTSGICVTIVESWQFYSISMLMISINAVYIGIDADWNDAETLYTATWGFQLCEQTFCTFFFTELMIRLGAFKNKLDFVKDKWVCLDIVTVTLVVAETWIYPNVLQTFTKNQTTGQIGGMGRMIRLVRLVRIGKLFQVFPELVTMVKGMVAGIRSVHAALMILLLLVYIFAIVLNIVAGDEDEVQHFFGTVRGSMVTLLVNGVLLDNVSVMTRALIDVANVPAIIFLAIFILLSALTVMNMVIGVLCEVVIDVSAEEKESHAKEKMQKTLFVMLQELDADNSGELSKEEVQSVIKLPEAVAIMNDIQVDTQYLLDVSEMLFIHPESTLPISVFMNIVLTLRGRREPTLNDMAKNHNLMMWAMETQLAHTQAVMTEAIAISQMEAVKMRTTIINELRTGASSDKL